MKVEVETIVTRTNAATVFRRLERLPLLRKTEERAGERFPRKDSHNEPLNPLTRPSDTLSPTGGEGRVRGRSAKGRFMGKRRVISVTSPSLRLSPCPAGRE
jgi:hypothetical protein